MTKTKESMRLQSYLQLMRWQQPIGSWLLLWPCWWSVTLASYASGAGWPQARLLALFLIGAVAMRSAGCIVNDLWDRKFDAQVERTKNRPLASGALSVRQALGLLILLLMVALGVLMQFNQAVFGLAVASLPLIAFYPAMKRITWWPQAFLGLTFNFGALMGWAAVTGELGAPALALYAAGFFWTLGYDTVYAHQDKADDARAGVKSTARLFGAHTRYWVAGFYGMMLACLALAGWLAQANGYYYLALLLPALHLGGQVRALDIDNPRQCLAIFKSNFYTGGLVWIALAAGLVKF